MAAVLNPYISFKGQAQQAMDFYQSVLGGELQVMTFADSGMPEIDGVMHAQLTTADGFTLMASDTPDEMPYQPGNNVTISISGDDVRLRDFFTALAEGGQVTLPMEEQMWGAEFGQLTDKFGINWMVNLNA